MSVIKNPFTEKGIVACIVEKGLSDVVVQIGQEQFPSVKVVLCLNDKIRREMESPDFDSIFVLPAHLTLCGFQALENYLGGCDVNVSRGSCVDILNISVEYEQVDLMNEVIKFIAENIDENMMMKLFNILPTLPNIGDVADLKSATDKFIQENSSRFLKLDVLKSLSIKAVECLLKVPYLILPNETYLLDLLLEYYHRYRDLHIDDDQREVDAQFLPLLSYVHLENVAINLYTIDDQRLLRKYQMLQKVTATTTLLPLTGESEKPSNKNEEDNEEDINLYNSEDDFNNILNLSMTITQNMNKSVKKTIVKDNLTSSVIITPEGEKNEHKYILPDDIDETIRRIILNFYFTKETSVHLTKDDSLLFRAIATPQIIENLLAQPDMKVVLVTLMILMSIKSNYVIGKKTKALIISHMIFEYQSHEDTRDQVATCCAYIYDDIADLIQIHNVAKELVYDMCNHLDVIELQTDQDELLKFVEKHFDENFVNIIKDEATITQLKCIPITYFKYPQTHYVFINQSFSIVPSNDGSDVSYESSYDTLPSGVVFDTKTGIISGKCYKDDSIRLFVTCRNCKSVKRTTLFIRFTTAQFDGKLCNNDLRVTNIGRKLTRDRFTESACAPCYLNFTMNEGRVYHITYKCHHTSGPYNGVMFGAIDALPEESSYDLSPDVYKSADAHSLHIYTEHSSLQYCHCTQILHEEIICHDDGTVYELIYDLKEHNLSIKIGEDSKEDKAPVFLLCEDLNGPLKPFVELFSTVEDPSINSVELLQVYEENI